MVHLFAAMKRRTASPRDNVRRRRHFPLIIQCDRSAVGALRPAVPRVARGLVALARARPTAISSTAPRSRNLPLRGRGIDRSAVAESTSPWSRNRPPRGRGIDLSVVAESTAPRSRNLPLRGRGLCRSVVADSVTGSRAKPGRQELTISGADVGKSLNC